MDVPGFEEPRKFACLCFYLCLFSVQYAQQIGIRALGKLKHRKTRFFSSLFKVAEFSKFSDLDFDHLRRFLSSIRVRQYKDHQNRSWNEPCRARQSFTWNLPEKLDSAGILAWEDIHVIWHVGVESSYTSSTEGPHRLSSATSSDSDRIFSWQNKNIPLTVREYSRDRIFFIGDRIFLPWVNSVRLVFWPTQWFFDLF